MSYRLDFTKRWFSRTVNLKVFRAEKGVNNDV